MHRKAKLQSKQKIDFYQEASYQMQNSQSLSPRPRSVSSNQEELKKNKHPKQELESQHQKPHSKSVCSKEMERISCQNGE